MKLQSLQSSWRTGDATSGELMGLENNPMDIPRRFMDGS